MRPSDAKSEKLFETPLGSVSPLPKSSPINGVPFLDFFCNYPVHLCWFVSHLAMWGSSSCYGGGCGVCGIFVFSFRWLLVICFVFMSCPKTLFSLWLIEICQGNSFLTLPGHSCLLVTSYRIVFIARFTYMCNHVVLGLTRYLMEHHPNGPMGALHLLF